jgi:D-glycero-alpha-D-manno-heptose-7-phosphate kinase
MIISRTPFRISFFGGGTDYPSWYRQNGGRVLATTIDKYCYISARYLPPFFDHNFRVVYSRIENCRTIGEIEHPAVRECLRHLDFQQGLEIHHDGDLPARSGLGSSSAFVVGLLHALYALQGRMPTRKQLADEAIHIEQERLREAVGSQDQVLAAYGGCNVIQFLTNNEITVTPLTFHPDRMQELNRHLLLFFTGLKRTAASIAETFVNEVQSKEQQLRLLDSMVEEGCSILASGDDLTPFGRLLHEGWRAKRALSSRVSNSLVDGIYSEALAAGAIGGKLIGAGGGGFMLIFARPTDHERIRERLRKLVHVPIRFEHAGSRIIFYEPGEDHGAQARLRASMPIDTFQDADVLFGKPSPEQGEPA